MSGKINKETKVQKKYIVILHQEGGCDSMQTACGTKVHFVTAISEEEAMSEVMYDLFELERNDYGKVDHLHGNEYIQDVFEVIDTPAKAVLMNMIRTAQDEISSVHRENELDKRKREVERLQKEIDKIEAV